MGGPDRRRPRPLGNPGVRRRLPPGDGAHSRRRPRNGGVDRTSPPARRKPGCSRGDPAHGDDGRHPGRAALDPRADPGAVPRFPARRGRVHRRASSERPRRRDQRSRHDVLACTGARRRDRHVLRGRHGGARAGHGPRHDPVHRHRRLQRSRSRTRRQGVGGPPATTPRGRAGTARPLPRTRAGHRRRRLLCRVRRSDPRHPLCDAIESAVRDLGLDVRAGRTPASARWSARSWAASP